MSGTQNGLSLVLATLGRTDEIGRFFSSLGTSDRTTFEVIVVDQNADNRLDEIVAEARGNGIDVQHIRVNRKGLSYARNIGVQNARYDLVGFPDDDCWYEPNTCEAIRSAFQMDTELQGLVARWVDRHDENIQGGVLDLALQRKFSGVPIASICLFFRTGLIREFGGFDTRLGVGEWFGSSEETDLVLRILAAEHRLCFHPEIGVRHYWSGSAVSLVGDIRSIFNSAKLRARGTGAIYAKHSLDARIVAKGLIAPLARAVFLRGGLFGGSYWLGTFIGRLQGGVAWLLEKNVELNVSTLECP